MKSGKIPAGWHLVTCPKCGMQVLEKQGDQDHCPECGSILPKY